jgi:hypothetical protein
MFEACNRNCEGCCNKDWDLAGLPECQGYAGYSLIMLTGGEPMLRPFLVRSTIKDIRKQNPDAKVYMYTAKLDDIPELLSILDVLDGLCVTLHEQGDVEPFRTLNYILLAQTGRRAGKSLRLNVFRPVDVGDTDTSAWKVKDDITWIKDCPLPTDEVLMRLPKETP